MAPPMPSGLVGEEAHGGRAHGRGFNGAPEHRLVEGLGAVKVGNGDFKPADGVRTGGHGNLLEWRNGHCAPPLRTGQPR